jgi:predicted transcriptional regulator
MRIKRRRSDIDIIAEMLKAGEKGAGKTEIMYSVNMSYSQIQKYLPYLISGGFIDTTNLSNPKVCYRVTEKGQELLNNLVSLKGMLGADENEDWTNN